MTRLLKDAVLLEYFYPYYLIKLVYWNPVAGYPGSVMYDYRILYDPKTNSFIHSSLDWIKDHRHKFPLKIEELKPLEMQSYFEEVVSIIHLMDSFGFKVLSTVVEKPFQMKIVYNRKYNR